MSSPVSSPNSQGTKPKINVPDAVIGSIAIVSGIAVIIYGFSLKRLVTGQLGPGLFPIVGGILFVIFGGILLIQALRGTTSADELEEILERNAAEGAKEEELGEGGSFEFTSESAGRLAVNGLVVIGGIIGYMLLADHLGFILTMFLVLFAIMVALKEKIWRAALMSAVITAILYLAFEVALLVQLPDGIVGF
ncbi:putative tricarboxylic transport membrane protein [Trueperella bonasi]|uniref:Tricarboxylic transport membrane protein n=1 Tax=Trueperella bonasi TaxID=312286 RepID=A0ABT9NGJ8_9ACTO|nr:tripartite tricarboxylate transporter TctB family protein [Trueperella bonasi]MDP9806310.1 putative tricarboxylic transport membrane protein [Trueperella bonasi]